MYYVVNKILPAAELIKEVRHINIMKWNFGKLTNISP